MTEEIAPEGEKSGKVSRELSFAPRETKFPTLYNNATVLVACEDGAMKSTRTMLAPNPNGSGSIVRVIVLGKSDDGQWLKVLGIDPISQNPAILKRFNPGYVYATRFYAAVATIIMFAGIGLSFFWHWWAFIVGFVIGYIIQNATQKSVADFAAEALAAHKDALQYFEELGLIWDAKATTVMPDRT